MWRVRVEHPLLTHRQGKANVRELQVSSRGGVRPDARPDNERTDASGAASGSQFERGKRSAGAGKLRFTKKMNYMIWPRLKPSLTESTTGNYLGKEKTRLIGRSHAWFLKLRESKGGLTLPDR